MSSFILKTKLFIPGPQPNLVHRPRLYQQLGEGLRLGRRLTLISASAGSGKTTLLSGWIAQANEQTAWLSLDPEDNDPARFWAYLLVALQTVAPGLGPRGNQPTDAVLPASLLNEVAELPRRVVLILDDFHNIANPAICADLAFWLEHLPPSLHLIVATRVDPPVPLARLRVQGQLTELRSDDLRFTPGEAAAFLNGRMGLNLAPADLEALDARTEGWIVGLQLAALSMQGRADPHDFIAAFTGSHRYILDYLAEEVLSRQPEPVRDFLLQTSILDRLCGPLCQAVTGHEESNRLLEQLKRSNLFTLALDDEQQWYRYHQLFVDLLRHRLKQTASAEQVGQLHLRASAWLEANAALAEAVQHAKEAPDFERVARLAEQAAGASLLDSRLTTLLSWVEGLPEAVLRAHPRLRLYQAWALFIDGRIAPAQQMLGEVRQVLECISPSLENDQLRGELVVLLGLLETLARGFMLGFDGDLGQATEAYSMVREQALATGNVSLLALATEGLALAQYSQGHLHQSAELCQQVVALGEQGKVTPLPLAAAGYIELAGISLEWNDQKAVERYLKQGMALCQRGGDVSNLAEAYLVQSQLCEARGEAEAAAEALRRAQQALPAGSYSPTNFNVLAQRARQDLSQGRLEAATHQLHALDDAALFGNLKRRLPYSMREVQQTLLARLFLAQNKPAEALAVLNQLHTSSQAFGRVGRVIEILMLKALALHAEGKPDDALAALEQSLALAEPEGYVRMYLDEGSLLIALLRLAAKRGIAPAYVSQLLAEANPESKPPALTPDSTSLNRLDEPLTPAELRVLQLIADGCSNRDIAERLVITLNTVKRHTNHIYSKLSVRSRTQAIGYCQYSRLVIPKHRSRLTISWISRKNQGADGRLSRKPGGESPNQARSGMHIHPTLQRKG